MSVATSSDPSRATRSSCARGFALRHSWPIFSSSASVSSNASAAGPCARTIRSSRGSRSFTCRSFATWAALSQKTIRAPAFSTM